MRDVKKVFTTGQVAKLCDVAPRTVSKWFDSGRLKGYRIPLSQDRRIPRENLIQFLKDNHMPLGELETEATPRVLLVAVGERIYDALTQSLTGCDVRCSPDGFTAGQKVSQWQPDVIVIDLVMGSGTALAMVRAVREVQTDEWVPYLIAMGSDDTVPGPLLVGGFDGVAPQDDLSGIEAAIRKAF